MAKKSRRTRARHGILQRRSQTVAFLLAGCLAGSAPGLPFAMRAFSSACLSMSNLPAPLSTWARNVSPSPTLAVDGKAKALQAAGEDVCGFAAGEPDFDTPEHIKEACIAALRAGKTKYAPTPGIEPLRQAIVERYAAEYDL